MIWGNPPKFTPIVPPLGRKVTPEANRIKVAKWRLANKERNLKNQRTYKEANLEKIKAQNKIQYERDKDKKKTRAIEFKNNNRELVLARIRASNKKCRANAQRHQNDRCKTDIQFKLSRNLRIRLRMAIKSDQKKGSAIAMLGCSILEFKLYLENKFTEGMSWENYGKWHIDHIKPLSKYDLTIEANLEMLCHYTNLQPLWAKDNLAKRDKIYDME